MGVSERERVSEWESVRERRRERMHEMSELIPFETCKVSMWMEFEG